MFLGTLLFMNRLNKTSSFLSLCSVLSVLSQLQNAVYKRTVLFCFITSFCHYYNYNGKINLTGNYFSVIYISLGKVKGIIDADLMYMQSDIVPRRQRSGGYW